MKLYAICWQDSSEPWGWAPAVGKEFEDDGSPTPGQVFFWDREKAEDELTRLREKVVEAHFSYLRETADRRYEERMTAHKARGGLSLPGLRVTPAGWEDAPPVREPEPQRPTDEELRQVAAYAAWEWSIQEYDVPLPPIPLPTEEGIVR